MALSVESDRHKRTSLLYQAGLLILIWLYVVSLHAANDGLWYQGDAPRHAANGLFWKDFLTTLPAHPFDFAVSYYLRYPVITPSVYPPGFYLLEAAAFSMFGPSPFIAKALVLMFTLAAALYLTVWLRRWVAEEAGWGGALLVLQPGVIVWSHAVMLNIPSMALTLAALYHARRWIEAPESRHFYATAGFACAGIMTYVHSVVVLPVFIAWIASAQRWELLRRRRVVVLMLIAAAIVIPWGVVAVRWAPVHASLVLPASQQILNPAYWTFYLETFPNIITVLVLVLAVCGIVGAVWDRRWRWEVILAASWIVIVYAILSFMMAREDRYALLLAPPTVILGVIGVCYLSNWGSTAIGRPSVWLLRSGIVAVLVFHMWMTTHVGVPVVEGVQEAVAFLEHKAPNERIFYEGLYNGIFVFYVRAGDPDFRRSVVRGEKLLYPSAMNPGWNTIERVSSPADVLAVLQKECGCRWLLLERVATPLGLTIKGAQHLRNAVKGPEFKFVTSFSLHLTVMRGRAPARRDDIQLDVYEFLAFARVPIEYEFHMPILGKTAVIRGKPIEGSFR